MDATTLKDLVGTMTIEEFGKRLASNFELTGKSIIEIRELIKPIVEGQAATKGRMDEVMAAFEKQKAGVELILRTMRNNTRSPYFLAGMEDENEAKKFSMIRALVAVRTGDWSEAGFEQEAMKATHAKASAVSDIGRHSQFLINPMQVMPEVITAVYVRSALISLDPATGQTRITVITGITSKDFVIPKFAGGCLAYWIEEEAEYTESLAKADNETAKLHKLGVLTAITADMRQFAPQYEGMVRNDMVIAMSAKLDRSSLYGSGAGASILGVANHPNVMQYSAELGAIVRQPKIWRTGSPPLEAITTAPLLAAHGAPLDFDGMYEMQGSLEDRDMANGAGTWIFSPKFKRSMAKRKVSNYSGQTIEKMYLLGRPYLSDTDLASVIGPFATSTQIQNNQTAGQKAGWTAAGDGLTLEHTDVFYSQQWNDLVMGQAGVVDFESDDGKGTGFTRDRIYGKVRAWFGLGYRRAESIVHCPDAKSNE